MGWHMLRLWGGQGILYDCKRARTQGPGGGTVRIPGLGVVGASAKNRGEMLLVQALITKEHGLWRDEVESGRPLGQSAVEWGAG